MTTSTKILIGAGVLGGGYLLYKAMSAQSTSSAALAAARARAQAPGTTLVNGVSTAISGAIASLFSPSKLGANTYGPSSVGSNATSAPFGGSEFSSANTDPYTHSTETGSYSQGAYGNYAFADSHPGAPLPEGVYGPPVPSADPSADVSGDDLMTPSFV